MRLLVEGYTANTPLYNFLWGFYVRGFKPWEHCQDCFYGSRAEGIRPEMGNGVVVLEPKTTFDYFYLHGNKRSGELNLNLGVRPKEGATARVVSKFGPVFTIEDAEEIEIQGPIDALAGSAEHKMYWKCPNFRFGMQMYPTPLELTGPRGPKVVRASAG